MGNSWRKFTAVEIIKKLKRKILTAKSNFDGVYCGVEVAWRKIFFCLKNCEVCNRKWRHNTQLYLVRPIQSIIWHFSNVFWMTMASTNSKTTKFESSFRLITFFFAHEPSHCLLFFTRLSKPHVSWMKNLPNIDCVGGLCLSLPWMTAPSITFKKAIFYQSSSLCRFRLIMHVKQIIELTSDEWWHSLNFDLKSRMTLSNGSLNVNFRIRFLRRSLFSWIIEHEIWPIGVA